MSAYSQTKSDDPEDRTAEAEKTGLPQHPMPMSPALNPAPASGNANDPAQALRDARVRQTTHGDFGDNAVFADQARDLLRSMKPGWSNCTAEQRLALDEIMLKVARILSGGNRVSEHWIDIQGYARLGDIPEVKEGEHA